MESTFLFVNPNFLNGVARTLDLFGTLDEYNRSKSAIEADQIALLLDNYAVKRDLMRAISSAQREHRKMLEHSKILEADTLG